MRRLGAAAMLACLALALAPANAETGRAQADFELGLRYRSGAGVAKDQGRAFALIEAAAMKRHAAAMFTLSNMLAGRDQVRARAWLEAAADLDYPPAMQQMALHLAEGTLGYAQDAQRSAHLLRKMAHAMKHQHGH